EFTLILPFLIAFVGASTDWGLGLFVSHVAQNAVREGARTAVTRLAVNSAAIKAEVNSRIPDTPLFTDFRNNSNIIVSCSMPGGIPFITVQTSGSFNFLFLRVVGFTNIPIARISTMRYERGLVCPVIT
ncbi:MAG: TadE family protein, partial [Candidatus Binatia bacterium]